MAKNTIFAKKIAEYAKQFYQQLQEQKYGRYKSWEHCYIFFHSKRGLKFTASDYDQLCLHLAFYLASWGMYRGSSFLLQCDYRIHMLAVKEIMNEDYDCLLGVKCCDLVGKKGSIGYEKRMKIWKLYDKLNKIYDPVRHKVYKEKRCLDDSEKKEIENNLSATLVTKILMGTLGCIPAYDRYFIEGVKHKFELSDGLIMKAITTGNCNDNSLIKLIDFYTANKEYLDAECQDMVIEDVVYPEGIMKKMPYPQMKVLDMAFWQIGYDIELKKAKQKKMK